MSAIHTWSITNLKQLNDSSGVVSSVFYSLKTVDSDDETINIESSGEVYLNTDDIIDFIPYPQLTEEVIIQWVRNHYLYYTNLEIQHQYFIEDQKNTADPNRVIIDGLPWN
jgi:hypothetical protein